MFFVSHKIAISFKSVSFKFLSFLFLLLISDVPSQLLPCSSSLHTAQNGIWGAKKYSGNNFFSKQQVGHEYPCLKKKWKLMIGLIWRWYPSFIFVCPEAIGVCTENAHDLKWATQIECILRDGKKNEAD